MTLPVFKERGDLPPGVHVATLGEVTARFERGSEARAVCTAHLQHVHDLAQRTGHLDRFIIFGSYITDTTAPNDIDIILVMNDSFQLEECPSESRALFEHATAQARYGASVFWIRPGLLIGETIDEFIAYWQTKRDGSKRGIVEVMA